MTNCDTCDGDGILVVADSIHNYEAGRTYASWCHRCEAGKVWREVGIE